MGRPVAPVVVTGETAEALLEALRVELAALRDRVAVLERWWRGPRDAADERLLIAIAAAAGSLPFTSRQVFAHARTVPALAAAVQDADIGSVRELGKLLRRVEGVCIDGLRLERDDVVRGGILWRIVRV